MCKEANWQRFKKAVRAVRNAKHTLQDLSDLSPDDDIGLELFQYAEAIGWNIDSRIKPKHKKLVMELLDKGKDAE